MNESMVRPRMYVDCDDESIRWALRVKMAKENLPSLSAAILQAIEAYVAKELPEVRARMAKGEKPARSTRGRKPS